MLRFGIKNEPFPFIYKRCFTRRYRYLDVQLNTLTKLKFVYDAQYYRDISQCNTAGGRDFGLHVELTHTVVYLGIVTGIQVIVTGREQAIISGS